MCRPWIAAGRGGRLALPHARHRPKARHPGGPAPCPRCPERGAALSDTARPRTAAVAGTQTMPSLAAASTFVGAPLAPRTAQGSTASRGASTVTCVATPSRPPASNKAKRSKVELIKEQSDFLRHPLMQASRVGARRCCRRRLPPRASETRAALPPVSCDQPAAAPPSAARGDVGLGCTLHDGRRWSAAATAAGSSPVPASARGGPKRQTSCPFALQCRSCPPRRPTSARMRCNS